MAKKKPSLDNVRELRNQLSQNQSAFWGKFGVTQSGGSRYENDRSIPKPLQLLMQAYLDGLLDDQALAKLNTKLGKRTD